MRSLSEGTFEGRRMGAAEEEEILKEKRKPYPSLRKLARKMDMAQERRTRKK